MNSNITGKDNVMNSNIIGNRNANKRGIKLIIYILTCETTAIISFHYVIYLKFTCICKYLVLRYTLLKNVIKSIGDFSMFFTASSIGIFDENSRSSILLFGLSDLNEASVGSFIFRGSSSDGNFNVRRPATIYTGIFLCYLVFIHGFGGRSDRVK